MRKTLYNYSRFSYYSDVIKVFVFVLRFISSCSLYLYHAPRIIQFFLTFLWLESGAGAVEFIICHAEIQIAFVEEKKIVEVKYNFSCIKTSLLQILRKLVNKKNLIFTFFFTCVFFCFCFYQVLKTFPTTTKLLKSKLNMFCDLRCFYVLDSRVFILLTSVPFDLQQLSVLEKSHSNRRKRLRSTVCRYIPGTNFCSW